MKFPIDLISYKPLKFDLKDEKPDAENFEQLKKNVNLVRDSIIFMTAFSGVKGLGGHTGGAYDIVPEILMVDGFINGNEFIYPVLFDAAGHRVAVHYVMAAVKGHIKIDSLLNYREYNCHLPGHPELDITPGINFSSGRLGHLWSFINGVAIANPEKKVVIFSSDGSMQEGNDDEAARFAVAKKLNVKIIVDYNDVTIAGHPSDYMTGFDPEKTLNGHGINTNTGDGEDLMNLYIRVRNALLSEGPFAVINKRKMAPGVPVIEGTAKGHDTVSFDVALEYLSSKNHYSAIEMLKSEKERVKSGKALKSSVYLGSTKETGKNRDDFGKIICGILEKMTEGERKSTIRVIDNDLEGSCGIHHIRKNFPEVYISGGVMERNNFSVAGGFGFEKGKQAIFATFSAFLEMVISEITMARLNEANILVHFSHAGVDYMADNTCHFGTSIFFTDNGLPENDKTRLYFPADTLQMKAIIESIFKDPGFRFVFSTRSPVPFILDKNSKYFFSEENGYSFLSGKDELIREGSAGYIVSYGEMLYRALDVVEKLRDEDIDIGLVNKPTLNVPDEDMLKKIGLSPFVFIVESQNSKTGLGIRFGTWLLERGYNPVYSHIGTVRAGNAGISEHMKHQGIDPDSIRKKIVSLLK